MTTNGVGVTRAISNWNVHNNHVERNLDTSAYSAAHPDDVLIVAGPPRLASVKDASTTGVGTLLPIGQLQMGSVSSSLPVQPMKAIGSSRKYFLADTAMNQIQIARMLMNGRNLIRALYHVAVQAGIDVGDPSVIFTPASYKGRENQQFWINLDSPIYRLPVGIGFLMKDRGGSSIGGFYAEVCFLQQWSLQFASGQSAVAENCALVCDRILPWGNSNVVGELAKLFDKALSLEDNTEEEKERAGDIDKIA